MKYIKIAIVLLSIGFLSSCEDIEGELLEAPAQSSLENSVVFSTFGLSLNAVDGILEPMGETNSYRGRWIPYYGFNTDSEWNYDSFNANSDIGELCTYDADPTNPQMNTENNAWAQMYAGIERANIVIKGLREFGNVEINEDMAQLLGTALTYRAIYYADLMKTWGDVPARFEPIAESELYIGKTSRDVIYKRIIADLGEASDLVAWPNESSLTSTVERINKAFVKSFRARLAMVASGFQQYPDGVRRSNDPELSVDSMYTLALNEATDVIESGRVQLTPSFETLWRNYNEEVLTAGRESLWEIPFAAGRGRVLFTFAVRHRGVDQHTGQPRGGRAGCLPTLFYDYNEQDLRRDVTCVPYEWGNPLNGFAQQQLVGLNTWYFGKFRYEWMNRYVRSSNDDGVNKIYMRYAEVLLIAAEAANELQGPGAAAPYLKEVRRRAFPSSAQGQQVDAYVDGLSSPQQMFDAIVLENKFEFTGEAERKQNLIRWNLLGENLREAKDKMSNLALRLGEYSSVPRTVFFKYQEDNETLDIFGLNRGETQSPGPEWTAFSWTNLENEEINSLFKPGVDPDDRQFWPIWQTFIDGSNGQLFNDYGY